jgi:hypothetical protein
MAEAQTTRLRFAFPSQRFARWTYDFPLTGFDTDLTTLPSGLE